MKGMRYILLRLFFNALSLVLAANLFTGISFDSPGTVVIAAVVVGLVNAFIRPVLFFLTLPITVLTLGLFTLVLNALLLQLAAWFVDGFHIDSFGGAFLSALVLSLVSFFGSRFLTPGRKR